MNGGWAGWAAGGQRGRPTVYTEGTWDDRPDYFLTHCVNQVSRQLNFVFVKKKKVQILYFFSPNRVCMVSVRYSSTPSS